MIKMTRNVKNDQNSTAIITRNVRNDKKWSETLHMTRNVKNDQKLIKLSTILLPLESYLAFSGCIKKLKKYWTEKKQLSDLRFYDYIIIQDLE